MWMRKVQVNITCKLQLFSLSNTENADVHFSFFYTWLEPATTSVKVSEWLSLETAKIRFLMAFSLYSVVNCTLPSSLHKTFMVQVSMGSCTQRENTTLIFKPSCHSQQCGNSFYIALCTNMGSQIMASVSSVTFHNILFWPQYGTVSCKCNWECSVCRILKAIGAAERKGSGLRD